MPKSDVGAGSCHVLVGPKAVWFGALVAKSVSLPNAWRLLFVGAVVWLHLFFGAHSFTRCRTSYPTLPLFPVFTNLIPLSDIFEVKISRLDER
jgi:hypothetical protein